MTQVGEAVSVGLGSSEGSDESEEEPDNWVELLYLDAHGNPIPEAGYVLLDLDGNELASGKLDKQGSVRVEGLDPEIAVVNYYFEDDPDYVIAEEFKPKENEEEPESGWWESATDWISDAGEWTWGVVQGDFNENPSVSQIVARMVLTLIPRVDQAGDVEDIIAALYKLAWQKRYDEPEPWFDLAITLIGCIPARGTVIKAVAKLLRKGAKAAHVLRLLRYLNWMGVGNGVRFLKNLQDDWAKYANDVGKHIDELLGVICDKLKELREVASGGIRGEVDELLADVQQARATALKKVPDTFEFLEDQLKKVLESVMKLIGRGPTKMRLVTKQGKERPHHFVEEGGKAAKGGVPQGLTEAQFSQLSNSVRAGAGHLGDDIAVHGSRAAGTAKATSDIDIAIRVSPEKFDELILARFGTPNPGSAKERTMLHAISTGKIQAGEAGLRGLRKQLAKEAGMPVDISVIRTGGQFDKGPFIPMR